MAVKVVVIFKMINIEHDQREGMVIAFGTFDLKVELLTEILEIIETGQIIGDRLNLDLVLCLFLLRDLFHHANGIPSLEETVEYTKLAHDAYQPPALIHYRKTSAVDLGQPRCYT